MSTMINLTCSFCSISFKREAKTYKYRIKQSASKNVFCCMEHSKEYCKIPEVECLTCRKITKNPKFCSQSCAATYNNTGVVRSLSGNKTLSCPTCNEKFETNKHTTDGAKCPPCSVIATRLREKGYTKKCTGCDNQTPNKGSKLCIICRTNKPQSIKSIKSIKEKSISVKATSLEDYFVGKVKIASHTLRLKLLNQNVLPHQCAMCGESKWNETSIPLQLDHIDGDNKNNALQNLRMLCGNCHYQTTTWGRRVKSIEEISLKLTRGRKEDLNCYFSNEKPIRSSALKKKIFSNEILPMNCDQCKLSLWMGKPIHLQLHHKNGISEDNSLENIQILCINCHSQTPNWTGKNKAIRRKLNLPVLEYRKKKKKVTENI